MSPQNFPRCPTFWRGLCRRSPGKGNDQALLINFLFSGLLTASVFSIGKRLFNSEVGFWGAAIALLMPRLLYYRVNFSPDAGLTCMTVLSFWCLTHWYFAEKRSSQWRWITAFGVVLGLALMTKQTCMFFLFVPILWSAVSSLWQKKWEKILQLIVSAFMSMPLWWGWYRTNFIYLFSTYEVSNSIAPGNEGDPALNTLRAWTYYWQDLPSAVSWILLLVPLVGICLHLAQRFPQRRTRYQLPEKTALIWLGVYFGGAYLLFSALYNKDGRYIMPYLPVVAIFLGYGLTQWRSRWLAVRWGSLACALFLFLGQLFPIPLFSLLAPPSYVANINNYPHAQVIDNIIRQDPYLRSNLGVIPSLNWLNHNNMNYFGAIRKFQVFGRELGDRPELVAQDRLAFDWLLTKTGDNANAKDAQLALAAELPKDPNFMVQNTWPLPDDTELTLYKRQKPLVTVQHFDGVTQSVQLDLVDVPREAIAGQPIPVTYNWTGNWDDLEKGLVLLTWSNGQRFWIHDHAIGFGMLYNGRLANSEWDDRFGVVEQTAMLAPADFPADTYRLQALYLDPDTGLTRPLATRNTTITLKPANPETSLTPLQLVQLDWLTQERAIAPQLGEGIQGLDPIFLHVARLNQYDPVQDYLQQLEKTLDFRLSKAQIKTSPQVRNWYYAKTLAHVLQEDPEKTIATLQDLKIADPDNPFVDAYIAFVHLYMWQPKQAELAVEPVLTPLKNVPEVQAIAGVAALLQGKIGYAWSLLKPIL